MHSVISRVIAKIILTKNNKSEKSIDEIIALSEVKQERWNEEKQMRGAKSSCKMVDLTTIISVAILNMKTEQSN